MRRKVIRGRGIRILVKRKDDNVKWMVKRTVLRGGNVKESEWKDENNAR